jgi:hypothetical protein
MPEEILTNEAGDQMSNDSVDYIKAINEMKQNSVSKEQYSKLQADNKRLLDALVSNKQIDIPEEKPVNVDELRAKLFKNEQGLSNLEFIDTALQLREALIARGEPDPFLPIGSKVQPDYDMVEKAETVAKCLKEIVDFADGDSGIFNAEYQRKVVVTMPARKNYK